MDQDKNTEVLEKNHDAEDKESLESNEPSECKIAKTEIEEPPIELVEVKVIYNKNKYDVKSNIDSTVAEFKKELQQLLGVPDSMQKLMYKGMLQDTTTLRDAGVCKGTKIVLVGSTLNDVLAVSSVSKQDVVEMEKASTVKEPLCKQKIHRKVLDRGLPEDVMPGIKNAKVEPNLAADIQNLHLTNDNSADNLCRADWLRARDSLENLLTPKGNSKSLGSDVSTSKSAHASNSSKKTKVHLADCPHSESLIGGNKGAQGSAGSSKMLTWDPWDKMGRKSKDNRNRKSEKSPATTTTRESPKHPGQDFDASGDTSSSEPLEEPKNEPEMYEYQPYRQPKNTKSVEFTNKVLVVYFNSDEVVCESTEPLKKEQDQQVRNKEMRLGHTPTTLVGKRKCLDDYMDAWFKK